MFGHLLRLVLYVRGKTTQHVAIRVPILLSDSEGHGWDQGCSHYAAYQSVRGLFNKHLQSTPKTVGGFPFPYQVCFIGISVRAGKTAGDLAAGRYALL